MFSTDTIAAISSATGRAARMIVRVSGAETRAIVGKLGLAEFMAGSARHEAIRFDGVACPAWVYWFASPRSYTGEDLLELHVPGNPILGRMLLDWLISNGARQAEAGDFTARAYFNGKLDLAQAEGVAAIIGAQSAQHLSAARQLMSGELSRRLRPAMDALGETLALVEAGIDFSDEGIEFLSADKVRGRIDRLDAELGDLMRQSARFEKLTHEPTIVLAGRPNAGKSTLANALAGARRSVVSPVAGTTRDALSVEIVLKRGMARLIDVAGIDDAIGDSHDREIEQQMRELAIRAVEQADVLVLVKDASDERLDVPLPRRPDLRVLSKTDIAGPDSDDGDVVAVSAKTKRGMAVLSAELDRLAFGSDSAGATLALTSRHLQALDEAVAALSRAKAVGPSLELLAAELRAALDSLGGTLGMITPDDILGRIFSTFCIGK